MTLNLESLLKATVDAGGSDLHLSTGEPPLIRLRGKMLRSQAEPLVEDQARELVYSVMSDDQRRAFEQGAEIDFAFEIPGLARFRANVFRQRRGVSAVYRVIVAKIRTLDELGTPPILRELAMRAFNAFWTAHQPGLKPTAGYPVDARRFRAEIATKLDELAIDSHLLWRCR